VWWEILSVLAPVVCRDAARANCPACSVSCRLSGLVDFCHQHKSLPAGNAILHGRDKGSERALEIQSTDRKSPGG
jgi:hypothetical protein